MENYNVIAETNEDTVVAEYQSEPRTAENYQSEAAMEAELIRMLQEQGYTYLNINSEDGLIENLRKKMEELNGYKFSDNEWDRFFHDSIANANDKIEDKTRKIQEDFVQVLTRDDGTSKNIKLIDKKNVHNNSLQVLNQYEVSTEDGARHSNRYDVTILVNGLPLVHIELKRRGVPIREAFNQIERYQRDSFWTGCGLYEYVQIFVISNGTNTKYYSNTTRYNHIQNEVGGKSKKSSNSFEFTSFWADAKNKIIPDLVDFTKTFFAKHTLLNILTKYCVFTSENMLLIMRPYQITATERIINKIEISHNLKKYGSVDAGGYIWHTTGSGKTLTSFKVANIASKLDYIDKVLFVVDRKDLDYQTMREYDRFEKGAANGNTSTAILERQLSDPNARIIITTIQKLSTFIKKFKSHEVYKKQVVMIFDECHRSQFGEMHGAIVKNFKNYYIFGFTGTPIFTANAVSRNNSFFLTTDQTFGVRLHTYTIVDAINDGNVLQFHIDYLSTMKEKDDIVDQQVEGIEQEENFMKPERIKKVTSYVLDHFNQKTYRNDRSYSFSVVKNVEDVASGRPGAVKEVKEQTTLSGFNSIFATESIAMAKAYYSEFKRQMSENPAKSLKIALIYSYAPNEEEPDGALGEEDVGDTAGLDKSSRDFLEDAIKDYNEMFHTNFSTDGDKFQNYYKDLSMRMKNKEIDMLIVVDMFLTGFDATTLNTLWVDKNLRMHGLIQTFSRTNRILNSVKAFGNIVCFRNLQKNVDDAIALYGDSEAGGIVVIRKFDDYYDGYVDEKGLKVKGYKEAVEELQAKYPLSDVRIEGEHNQREFIKLFGDILKRRNLLFSFDEFEGKQILSERDFQDYTGRYQDLRDEWVRVGHTEKVDISDDLVFEMELIRQVEVNIDYILMLVAKYHEGNQKDKELLTTIEKSIGASPKLRSKKELIDNFIAGINGVDDVLEEWVRFVNEQMELDLSKIIAEENLKESETRRFIENSFRDGEIKTIGTELADILPPMSMFNRGRADKKQKVTDRLQSFFEKYYGTGANFKAEKKRRRIGLI